MVNQSPSTVSHGSTENIFLNNDVSSLFHSSRKQVWLPARINANGTVENLSQGVVENQGPEKGHWATVNGKRKWIEGQHNHNRQRNPRNVEEAVIGTRLMNTNPKMIRSVEKDGSDVKYLEQDSRIIRLGRLVTKHETFFDKGFDDSLKRARKIVSAANEMKAKVGARAGVGGIGVPR